MYAPMSTEIDPLRAAGALVRFVRVLDHRMGRNRCDDGIGLAELGVLSEIDRGTELSSAIARTTRLDPARVTRIVDRLVERGLVSRSTSPQDRRRAPLELGEQGRERLEKGRADIRAAMGTLLTGLSDDEQEAFALALGAIQRVLSQPEG